MEQKVLVTGANGLIGEEICKQLADEFYVVAVDNGFRSKDIPKCDEYINEDIDKFLSDANNDYAYIFHMGNINGTSYFYDMPNQLIQNNIQSDFAVFDFAKQNHRCKLIYASSSEVVAGTKTYPTAEDSDISIQNIHNPRWSYRLGKIVGENYLINSPLNYLIIRFFNVYGEHSHTGHFVRDIIDKLHDGNFELVGSEETRCFCYVTDAVEALLHIKDTTQEIVNIGSDEEISVLEAANLIAQSIGKEKIHWLIKQGLEGSVKRRKPDLSKLKALYPNYSPQSLKDVLNKINFLQKPK